MKKYLIGTPGQPARMGLQRSSEEGLSSLLEDGEVYLVVDEFENGIISEDGLSFVPTGIDIELENVMVRSIRTGMLAACDWTQAADAPLTPEKKAEWAAYRQELRDITTTQPNRHRDDIVWPVEP